MKKTALLEKLASGQRARGASHAEYTMEFSDLLDGIAPEQPLVELDVSLADLVMFPVSRRFDRAPDPIVTQADDTIEDTIIDTAEQTIDEIATAPVKVSRFATSGIDDDLLPVRVPRRRPRR